MKRFLKWLGIVLGVFFVLMVAALSAVYISTERRLKRVYSIPAEVVYIPTDAASIERGGHIFQFRGCQACHSGWSYVDVPGPGGEPTHVDLPDQKLPHMEGYVYLEDPALGQVNASNLTSGEGGVAGDYQDADWVRAIRHGIRPDGTPLLFMPSTEFYFLSDEDLGAVIAYIKSAPPADHVLPRSKMSMTGRLVMTLVKGFTFIPAELIPHAAPRPTIPKPGNTPEYGEYLTLSCKVCHGLTMSGGRIPGFPASWPPALNLTFGGGSTLPNWSEADFIMAIRTGRTPDGRQLRAQYMPWQSYRFMNDDELRAVWVYLQFLPKKDYGNR